MLRVGCSIRNFRLVRHRRQEHLPHPCRVAGNDTDVCRITNQIALTPNATKDAHPAIVRPVVSTEYIETEEPAPTYRVYYPAKDGLDRKSVV